MNLRLRHVSIWLRISAVLTLIALALMVWSVLVPTPLPVMLAMTVGQGLGTAAFGIFGLVVLKDLTRSRRAKRDSLQVIPPRDSVQDIALTRESTRDSLQNIALSKDEAPRDSLQNIALTNDEAPRESQKNIASAKDEGAAPRDSQKNIAAKDEPAPRDSLQNIALSKDES